MNSWRSILSKRLSKTTFKLATKHVPTYSYKYSALSFGTVAAVCAFGYSFYSERAGIDFPRNIFAHSLSEDKETLPLYTLAEIKKHDSVENRVWVVFEGLVYDITDFVSYHPGGDLIMLAAGSFLDPFWNLFPKQHLKPETRSILNEYLIGKLDASSTLGDAQLDNKLDPFHSIPDGRDNSNYIVHTERPFNAESHPEALSESYITPTEKFYVRNHLWTPLIDENAFEEFKLTIVLPDENKVQVSLKELLETFPQTTITATLQCSGNRRRTMIQDGKKQELPAIHGIDWDVGAIGTAEFTGIKLSQVLKYYFEPQLNSNPIKHVRFYGLERYGASIPAARALCDSDDVLLAFAMNGKPLTPDHGYPVRVVVPGVTAARSVKWLSKIELSDEESDSHWQRRDYKILGPTDLSNPNFEDRPSIQVTPVQSAILHPKDGASLPSEAFEVDGYAWVGGGRQIARVDVSFDDGKTWKMADFSNESDYASIKSSSEKTWAWRKWRLSFPANEVIAFSKSKKPLSITVRAVDTDNNIQPSDSCAIYNIRGLLSNSYHKIQVFITSDDSLKTNDV